MLELKVKDIRETFEETLGKFYAFPDFSINPTKVMDRDKEFRIEFRIYDAEFWMDIDPSIASVRIATRVLGVLESIQMWFSKPFEYDKSKFEFGWRTDLEVFFDAFHEALLEKLAKTQKANMAAVYGSSTKADETKTSIFNGLKEDKEEEDEYI